MPTLTNFFVQLKEEPEEEDGETIERVLWHQPKGVAEEAMRNDQSAQPTVVSLPSDFNQQWDELEFYIKWKGQSYLHCQWKTLSELQSVSTYLDYKYVQIILQSGVCVQIFYRVPCSICFYLTSTQQVSGFKKVLNYTKRVAEELRYKRALSREEVNQ